MSTSTSRLALYKPADDGSEFVDVSQDLNQNLDKIDAAIGFIPATSSTPPSSPFAGMARQDTDTNRSYYRNGANAAWIELLNDTGTFGSDVKILSGKKIGIGNATPNGLIDVIHTNVTDMPMRFKQASDSSYRTQLNWNGLEFGPGTGARDVFIYRSGVGEATVDSTLSVTQDLEVSGNTTVDDLTIGGDLTLTGNVLTALNVDGDFQASGIGGRWIKYKAASTDRLSTTTPTADPDLVVPLLANATYLFTLNAMAGSPAAADFRTAWSIPSGATGLRHALGPGSSATARDNISMRSGAHGFGNIDYGCESAGAYIGIQEYGMVVTSATAGNLSFMWSQVTSTASNTTLSFCSSLEVIRVA